MPEQTPSATKRGTLLPVALSLASALLLALALPMWGQAFVAWFSFVPLLLGSRLSRPRAAAAYGFLTAIACGVIVAGPIASARQVANLTAAFGMLGAVLAAVSAFASIASRRLHPAVWPFAVAAAGVTAELVTAMVFPVNVAITQFQTPVMLSLASVTGVWGVSFLIWLASASLCNLKCRQTWPAVGIGLATVAMSLAIGFPAASSGKRVIAAVVQAKRPSDCAALTSSLPNKVSVAVWPENLMHTWQPQAFRSAASSRVYIVASFCQHSKDGRYNTARLISPSGGTLAIFEKQCIFGNENLKFRRGSARVPVSCSGVRVGCLVCFDTEITRTARVLASDGAQIILIPNHDPECPNSLIGHLHGTITSFRAAENGVPIVQADSKSLSRIVDGNGRILALAPEKAQTAVWASVQLKDRTTFFTRFGDWLAYLCVLGTTLCLIRIIRARESGA